MLLINSRPAISLSEKKFSSLSIDHAHEQLNASDGGAFGITENEAALGHWINAGPEIVRIIHEFEGDKDLHDLKHH